MTWSACEEHTKGKEEQAAQAVVDAALALDDTLDKGGFSEQRAKIVLRNAVAAYKAARGEGK
jgi:hypothetical protein